MTFAGNVQHEMGRAAYSILPGNSPGIHRDANAAENARRTGARAFRGKHAPVDQGRNNAARLPVAGANDIGEWQWGGNGVRSFLLRVNTLPLIARRILRDSQLGDSLNAYACDVPLLSKAARLSSSRRRRLLAFLASTLWP